MSVVLLGDVLKEERTRVGSPDGKGLPLLGVSNVDGLHRSTRRGATDKSRYLLVKRNWFAYNPMRINVGSVGLCSSETPEGIVSPDYVVFSCRERVNPEFLHFWLRSPSGLREIAKHTAGSVRERLYFKSLAEVQCPLPSLAEQDRVRRIGRAIESLRSSRNSQFLQVESLRQTILQLAVMGRLVPQDPSDLPASELLKKIQAEKQRLNAEGKIRKTKALPPIEVNGEPHEVPSGWRWVRLNEICMKIADTDHKMPKAVESGEYPYVSARDLLDDGTIDIAGAKRISEEDFDRLGRKVVPRRHDIVYSRIGTVGKARLVATNEPFLASYSCCVIRPIQAAIVEQLLVYLLESALVLDQARTGATGIGVPDLGLNTIRSFMIPLAPLAEQKRIVAKVDQLMTLCDDLEAKLQQTQTDADNLLTAIVHELVAAGSGVSAG